MNFSIVQGTNICLVYVIDAYRPVAGEITLAVMGFKCKSPGAYLGKNGPPYFFSQGRADHPLLLLVALFGFLLSFYTNPWVDSAGYQDAYGAMAGISAAVIILWAPLYAWGKKIRIITWSWPLVRNTHWHVDRETGE